MTKLRTIYGVIKGYKENNQTGEGEKLHKYRTFHNKCQIAKGLNGTQIPRTHVGKRKVVSVLN
jgi:hypothetical protein